MSQVQLRGLAFGVPQEIGGRAVEGGFVDGIENALANAPLSGVGIDRTKGFELLQVPKDGLVAGANGSPNVAGGGPLRMLPQVTEYGRAEGVHPEDRNHGFRTLGQRNRRSDISGHPIILSQNVLSGFHRLTQYDTLPFKSPIESDTNGQVDIWALQEPHVSLNERK